MQTERVNPKNGLRDFLIVLAVLFAIRVGLSILAVSSQVAEILAYVSGAVFLALPLYGLFRGASAKWSLGSGAILVLLGVSVHIGFCFLSRGQGSGMTGVLLSSLAQCGILMWCLGLGICLSYGISDKNLVLPIAIFLAGFDIFLVFMPQTFVNQQVSTRAEFFNAVKVGVPTAQVVRPGEAPKEAHVSTAVDIGPADFFFCAFFFAILYRFGLRAAETIKLLVPVLIAYLAVVLFFHIALPALLPIGLTVLWVNRKEFNLSQEEKYQTIAIAVVIGLLAGWAIYRGVTNKAPAPPVAPLPAKASPAKPGSAETPAKAPRG